MTTYDSTGLPRTTTFQNAVILVTLTLVTMLYAMTVTIANRANPFWR